MDCSAQVQQRKDYYKVKHVTFCLFIVRVLNTRVWMQLTLLHWFVKPFPDQIYALCSPRLFQTISFWIC